MNSLKFSSLKFDVIILLIKTQITKPLDISVVIRAFSEDLTIKVSDKGGGIKKEELAKVWTYMFTTATPKEVGLEYRDPNQKKTGPMAGFGYGLPLSRLVSSLDFSYHCLNFE